MTSSPEFPIPIHDLDASGKDFRFPLRDAWVLGALEGTDVLPAGKEGRVEVRVSKSGSDVVVRGSFRAEVTVPCARCLKAAPVSLREELSALAVPRDQARSASNDNTEEDLPTEEADILAYDGDTVFLDDLVRDELLLGIPMIPLCSDGCPGIRPKPLEAIGPSPIDPRLEPLLKLKKT